VTLTYTGNGVGDGGDQYVGLDRFGRIVDQRWVNGSGTDLVRYDYTYDRDGNRLSQTDLVGSDTQSFTYDNLNQLTASGSVTWSPDAAGNFASITVGGTATSRTVNAQNEVTAVGSTSLTYDADGNTLTDDQGNTAVYDAWNRVVAVSNGSGASVTYSYDALDRRVIETDVSTSTSSDAYFDANGRVLLDGSGRNVWDPTAVSSLVLRDSFGGGGTTRLFALQDSNRNVAAVVATSGAVQERYTYSPYGQVTYLTAGYGSRSASAVGMNYLFQGLRYDTAFNLYDNAAREYSPTLMRFMQNDPIGLAAGDANTYRFENNNPTDYLDPSGMWSWSAAFDAALGIAAGVSAVGITVAFAGAAAPFILAGAIGFGIGAALTDMAIKTYEVTTEKEFGSGRPLNEDEIDYK
jgi:RHS repeat-associated protein